MTRKQKKLTAAAGIISGTVILAGAALANYSTSNGYEVGKAAAIGLLENENYTAEGSVRTSMNGTIIKTAEFKELYNRNGDVVLNSLSETSSIFNDSTKYEEYVQDGSRINISPIFGTLIYSTSSPCYGIFDNYYYIDAGDKAKMQKYIRFAELLGDTLVGDLKNNVVYISGDDESSTYEISLNSVQVPEFINAGLAVLISEGEISGLDYSIMSDPYVSDFTLRFTVDTQGRLTDGYMSSELKATDNNGAAHTFNAEKSLKIYDYGTTQPQRVDIDTLENVRWVY